MNQLQRAWIWLSRMGHSRGFGIQSPSDYSFVRNVVNEHWPYYAYDEMGAGHDWITRKRGRLYLRLANWQQPATISAFDHVGYLTAGCSKATLLPQGQAADLMLVKSPADALPLLPHCPKNGMMVIEQIASEKALWEQVIASPQAVVTFDLYYCGIVFFNPDRYKHHYIINF